MYLENLMLLELAHLFYENQISAEQSSTETLFKLC